MPRGITGLRHAAQIDPLARATAAGDASAVALHLMSVVTAGVRACVRSRDLARTGLTPVITSPMLRPDVPRAFRP
jgi:hypothetical protein